MNHLPTHEVLPVLQDVARELEAAGAVPGEDFFVHFVTTGMVSSDYYGLRPTQDGRLEVYYSERGEQRVLESTTDLERARELFTARVVEVARARGSGQRR